MECRSNLSGWKTPSLCRGLANSQQRTYEVVHSLAKWKRHTLARFGTGKGKILFVHMKALRPDEDSLDATLSLCRQVGLGKDKWEP